jgi:TPR repeat protein
VADLKEAVGLAPGNTDVLMRLGYLLESCPDRSVRNSAEAVEVVKKACETTGWREFRPICMLAGIYYMQGDFRTATRYQEQAFNLTGVDDETRKTMKDWLSHIAVEDLLPSGTNSASVQNPNTSAATQTNIDIVALRRSAESGEAKAQIQLSGYLNDGSHGCPTNRVEAYKWAALAEAQGNREGRYLVQELRLFLTPEEISKGQEAVREFQEKNPGK